MGHTYVERLPRTQSWRTVVDLLREGADAATVAKAVVDAARPALRPIARDPGVVAATWYLIRLPIAAGADDFGAALRRIDLDVRDPVGLMELLGAVSDALDRATGPAARSDLGEVAQTALVETLADRFGARHLGLVEPDPADRAAALAAALAAAATDKQFGLLAAAFFARLVRKALDFFLTRVLADQVGPGRRFRTLSAQRGFTDALGAYAAEVAAGVDDFAGGWFVKWDHRAEGRISRQQAGAFLDHAADKLTWALKLR